MRNVRSYVSRTNQAPPRSRTPPNLMDDDYDYLIPVAPRRQPATPVRRPETPPAPTSNNDGPSASTTANESDSDIEIVSQTSSATRKRPRYDDAH
uniref:Uncharacterized protein n=1 Tax=Panagrolaimus davidi TaxID=227884 RepID=A0A914QYC8_9BILA